MLSTSQWRSSKPHPVAAALCDLYVFGELYDILDHVLGIDPSGFLWASLPAAVTLIVVVIYHAFFARRVRFLTPGELVTGRVTSEGNKEWRNPYHKSRWPAFLCFLFATGNGPLTRELPGTAWIVGDDIATLALLLALVLVGRGYAKALFVAAAYALYSAVVSFLLQPATIPLGERLENAQPVSAVIVAGISIYFAFTLAEESLAPVAAA